MLECVKDQVEIEEKVAFFDERWFGCDDVVGKLIKQAIGCQSQCMFCGRKCELRIHLQDQKHSCNTVGHQMRVFRQGHFKGKTEKLYPSLKTCDLISLNTQIFVDGTRISWRSILDTQMSDWEVKNKEEELKKNKNLQFKMETYEKFWEKVGQKYCDQYKWHYIKKMKDLEENDQMHDSGIVVIALDKSTSMGGRKWARAQDGAKLLINYILKHHTNPQLMQIVIIHFNHDSFLIHQGRLKQDPIPDEVWEHQVAGGTEYGPVMEMSFEHLKNFIDQKDTAKYYFFTDGTTSFPQKSFENIQDYINSNGKTDIYRKKLEILLMSECKEEIYQDGTECVMKQMNAKLNEICYTQLFYQVDPLKLGEMMIENFENFKFDNQNQI